MKCLWCKKGEYRVVFAVQRDEHGVPMNLYRLARYGIRAEGDDFPEIWAAECCGHLAIVRPDLKK